MPAELPLHIDSTMRSAFVSCPQKFFLEFCHGLRPRGVSVDLHAGGAFAASLEEYYKAIHLSNATDEGAAQRAHAAFMTYWGDFEIPEFKRTAKTKDRVWEAVESYIAQYPPRTDTVQPFFAADGKPTFEYTFAIPLEPIFDGHPDDELAQGLGDNSLFPRHPSGSPFIYCGRFDMLGKLGDRPVVRDEKTTGSSIGQAWADQWNLRSQFMGYAWACQQAGISLDTVVVRGLAIQKTQIVHAEAVKTYPDYMIAKWHEQLRRDLWRLRRSWDEGYFDLALGEACTSYGGCTFTNVCTSNTPENWFSDFEVRRWNPLVKDPTKNVE